MEFFPPHNKACKLLSTSPMTTHIVFLVFIAFFLLYNTSKKAELNRAFLVEKWAQDHITASKVVGLGLLLGALAMCVVYFGIGSGTFGFFVILMTVGSCVVLFAPLRYVKVWVLSSAFLLSFLFELIWK